MCACGLGTESAVRREGETWCRRSDDFDKKTVWDVAVVASQRQHVG